MSAPLSSPPAIPPGLESLLPMFVAEMVRDGQRLGTLTQGAAADLADHAHAMRGKAAMFGETCLYDLLTLIENAALAGDHAPIPDLVDQVSRRVQALGEYLAGHGR
ncbi:MAG TPA: Hpt domain-containing protein [Magnetospirillum sp.]|nr:Hpt domain-containing protein [Magnetospirillum sp.]